MRVEWIRFFRAVRWRTRWRRKRARSRSGSDLGRRQPDLGHKVTTCELGEDARVDLVRLGSEWRTALGLDRVRDRDVPAAELECVVDEACPGHRLDRRTHFLAVAQDMCRQRPERVRIRTNGRHLDRAAILIEHVHIEPLSRQVQSGVQHRWASWCWFLREPNVVTGGAPFHGIRSCHGQRSQACAIIALDPCRARGLVATGSPVFQPRVGVRMGPGP
jgi:hypothetical protein